MQLGNQKRGNKWFARCWLGAPTRRMANTTELAGIECRACGRRTLVPFDRRLAGLNGSAWPVFGRGDLDSRRVARHLSCEFAFGLRVAILLP